MEGHSHSGYILTLCERKIRFPVLRILRSKHAEEVTNQIIKGLRKNIIFTISCDDETEVSKRERANENWDVNHFSVLRITRGKRGLWKIQKSTR